MHVHQIVICGYRKSTLIEEEDSSKYGTFLSIRRLQ